jgi:GNAT superfamily N-acetyltransferase
MHARSLTKADFDHIVQVIDEWWGGLTRQLAHPIFFYELGEMNQVVEIDGVMAGFLFGFLTPSKAPVGYIHLVGVHPGYRRRGVGKFLYAWYEGEARKRGCASVKAITTLGNDASLLFHRGIGWDAMEVPDYAGPGRPRIVFTKRF